MLLIAYIVIEKTENAQLIGAFVDRVRRLKALFFRTITNKLSRLR